MRHPGGGVHAGIRRRLLPVSYTSPRETYFRRKVVEFIAEQGWKCCFLTGNTSWPDLLVVPCHAPSFYVELKRERNGAYGERPFQKVMREWLETNGHSSILIDPYDPWKNILLTYGQKRGTMIQ